MYTRQRRYSSESAFVPSAPQPEVRVPLNYSGVAFDGGLVRPSSGDELAEPPLHDDPPTLSTPSAASCFPDAERDTEPTSASEPEAHSKPETGFDSEDLLIIGIALLLLNGELSADAIWLLMLLLF